MKILTYIKIILLGSIGLIAALGLQTDLFADGNVKITPHIETVLPSDVFNLFIAIDENVETVKGYLIDISVDTNIVELNSCFHTTFFPGFFLYWKSLDTGSLPMYEVLDVLLGADAFVNGPGNLVGMEFTARNPGISPVGFEYVLLTDTVGIEGDTIPLIDSLDGFVVVCSAGQSMLLCDPPELEFSAEISSGNPAPQTIEISNPCYDNFSWTAAESASWFDLSQYSGAPGDPLTVTVAIAGLSSGQYSDIITIEAPQAYNPSIEIAVVLNLEGEAYLCGDANADTRVNVSDAVYIINYVFAHGDPPVPINSGDVNCDNKVNVSDAVYIINYVFSHGKTPCDIDDDGETDC